ncbi:uncharacterized protein [Dermacentor andersoni]|uniref:uncharacterized protein n=1 Tax=Dermacentor andersoni TaxID=34620 RepID=UPI003B3AD394
MSAAAAAAPSVGRRRLSAQQRRAESEPATWAKGSHCSRQSLPSCMVPAPTGRRPSAGFTWFTGRFGKRAQSDPWISDRIRRYFLTRTFNVGPGNALLLSLHTLVTNVGR